MLSKSFDQVNTNQSWDQTDLLPSNSELEDLKYLIVLAMDRIAGLERRVAALEEQRTIPPEAGDQNHSLPSGVTKMLFQLFENFRKPKGKRPRTQALVQIKLYAWAPDKLAGYWLVPMHRPDQTKGRRYIRALMPTIDHLGRDKICYAGRLGDLELYIGHAHGLMVMWGDKVVQANDPSSKPNDAADNAPMYQWYCDLAS